MFFYEVYKTFIGLPEILGDLNPRLSAKVLQFFFFRIIVALKTRVHPNLYEN